MTTEQRYLALLKRALTRADAHTAHQPYLPKPQRRLRRALALGLQGWLRRWGLELMRRDGRDSRRRALGRDHTPAGETMVGPQRLEHLEACIRELIAKDVPGDLIETGVWRGGVVIWMRAVLAACGDDTRRVWAADSFEGLPPADADRYREDRRHLHWTDDAPAVSLEAVKRNFARYDLLDERVHFLRGWFRDTLPAAPIEALALVRLDGVTYDSTLEALRTLYPKLSPGGYLIADDFALEGCRRAVLEYRDARAISEPLVEIDGSAVFWQKRAA